MQDLPQSKIKGRPLIAFTAILFGTESIVLQLAYGGGWTVFSLMCARFVLASIFLYGAILISHSPLITPKGYRLETLLLAAVQFITGICLFQAVAHLPAGIAILFFYAYPSITAVVSRLVYKRPLQKTNVIALVISAGGLILLYWSTNITLSVVGIIYAVLAATFQAFRMNIAEHLMPHVNTLTYNFNAAVFISGASAVILLFGADSDFSFTALTSAGWLSWLYLALLITGVATFLLNYCVKIVGAVECSLFMLLEPPTTVLLAFLIFGDQMTAMQLVGGLLILTAIAVPVIFNKHK